MSRLSKFVLSYQARMQISFRPYTYLLCVGLLGSAMSQPLYATTRHPATPDGQQHPPRSQQKKRKKRRKKSTRHIAKRRVIKKIIVTAICLVVLFLICQILPESMPAWLAGDGIKPYPNLEQARAAMASFQGDRDDGGTYIKEPVLFVEWLGKIQKMDKHKQTMLLCERDKKGANLLYQLIQTKHQDIRLPGQETDVNLMEPLGGIISKLQPAQQRQIITSALTAERTTPLHEATWPPVEEADNILLNLLNGLKEDKEELAKVLQAQDKDGCTAILRAAERDNEPALQRLFEMIEELDNPQQQAVLGVCNAEKRNQIHMGVAFFPADTLRSFLWEAQSSCHASTLERLLLQKDNEGNTCWDTARSRTPPPRPLDTVVQKQSDNIHPPAGKTQAISPPTILSTLKELFPKPTPMDKTAKQCVLL